MAQKDLITLARAKQNIQSITDASQDALLSTLVTAVSDGIAKYCRRDFYQRSYDELYNGNGDRRLLLREYPLLTVDSVRYRPVTVLKIQNSATSTNQQARVQVTSTGLTLVRVASGVKTTDTSVTWAGYPTLAQAAAAITALGNGWTAQAVGDSNDYGSWPSADLHVPPSYGGGSTSQGSLTARGQFAELKLHTYELAGFQWDVRGWLLRAIPYSDPELLHPEDLVFPTGINNFRVQYTAGYPSIPESVQEACAEWVGELYAMTLRDPGLQTQNIAGSLAQSWGTHLPTVPFKPSSYVGRLLAPYRRHAVGTEQS